MGLGSIAVWLQVFAAAINFVKDNKDQIGQFTVEAEGVFGVGKASQDKLAYVMARLEVLFTSTEKLASEIPWEKLVPFLIGHISQRVVAIKPTSTLKVA